MIRVLVAVWLAGCVLGALELTWGLVAGRALFLNAAERWLYAAAALSAIASCVLLAGALLSACTAPSRAAGRLRLALAAGVGALVAWAGWLLTAGRTVRAAPLRPWAVVASAVVAAGIFWAVLRLVPRLARAPSRRPRVLWSAAGLSLAAVALALDALILPRNYPAFHVALFLGAIVLAALSGVVWQVPLPKAAQRRLAVVPWLMALGAPFLLARVAEHPNASFVVREKAPWTAKLLALSIPPPAVEPPSAGDDQPPPSERAAARGADLRDRDVLLITIDALRADTLEAYGGRGLTPNLDRLAEQSVVFRRAYTPAPHTSYALVSLLTGKFIKPVVELKGRELGHVTLPDLLRRYGYRTAAFYPPAIFFVDGAHFLALHERGFGFEYRKEMFASAAQRVKQLESYLAEAPAGLPLFVWVHLFEPHEPYAPAPDWPHQGSARERYEGEVVEADRGAGELVRAFRAARPSATVIVSADHGEEFGDHGGYYHGTTLYDEQVRVPLLWSSPEVATPRMVDTPVELVDVGTTILSTAGIPREARMRGDDLGAVLLGHTQSGPRFAFASVAERNMVTDGRLKVVCGASDVPCHAFDLERDPGETRNVAMTQAAETAGLRAALQRFLGSIADGEALAVDKGIGFPPALARARLGAPGAGAALIPLLGDARTQVRCEAARALGELGMAAALPMLQRLAAGDASADVRAEAAVAALRLGQDQADEAAIDAALQVLAGARDPALARRAALALADVKRAEAAPVLLQLAADNAAEERLRLRAIEALGSVGGPTEVRALVALLSEPRLRVAVCRALARLGDPGAADAIAEQLARERYQPARRAEAEALLALGDRRALALTYEMLGRETSLPGGVRLLLDHAPRLPGRATGGWLSDAGLRTGAWRCQERTCRPGADAQLVLRVQPDRESRVTLLVTSNGPHAVLSLGERRFELVAGEQQLSFTLPASRRPVLLPVAVRGEVGLLGAVVVPAREEIPPPAPEPWDAGT